MAVTKVAQVSNVSSAATLDQVRSLFSFLGKIDDIRLFPKEDSVLPVTARICFILFDDPTSVGMAQHLTNTVFIDRPLQVNPYPEGSMPEESKALQMVANLTGGLGGGVAVSGLVSNPGAGLLPTPPQPLMSQITHPPAALAAAAAGAPAPGGDAAILLGDSFSALGVPQPPPLNNVDPSKVEEIRRTIYVGNLDSATVQAEQLLTFFQQVGEVKYVRMAGDETQPTRFAFVEFTDQGSVAKGLTYNGVMFAGRPIKINHSNNAIVKPPAKTQEAIQKELAETMKQVRDAQALIQAAIDPALRTPDLKDKPKVSHPEARGKSKATIVEEDHKKEKKRSQSPASRRRGRSRSRSRRRSRSRSRRRSRSRSRRRSRSRPRRRSRSWTPPPRRRSRSPRRRRSRTPPRRSRTPPRKRRSRTRSPPPPPRRRRSRSRSKSRDKRRRSRTPPRSYSARRQTRSRSRPKVTEIPKTKTRSRSPPPRRRSPSRSPPPRRRSRTRSPPPPPPPRRRSRTRSPPPPRRRRSPSRSLSPPHLKKRLSRSRSGSRSPPRKHKKEKKSRRSRSKERSSSSRKPKKNKDREKEREKDRKETRDRDRSSDRKAKDRDEKEKEKESKSSSSSSRVKRDYDEEEKGFVSDKEAINSDRGEESGGDVGGGPAEGDADIQNVDMDVDSDD